MKKILLTKLILVASLFATDYSTMSIDELNSLKGSVSTEDKDAFKSAMQSKMKALTPEERETYKGSSQSGSNAQKLRDGSGSGGMYKGSKGQGGKR